MATGIPKRTPRSRRSVGTFGKRVHPVTRASHRYFWTVWDNGRSTLFLVLLPGQQALRSFFLRGLTITSTATCSLRFLQVTHHTMCNLALLPVYTWAGREMIHGGDKRRRSVVVGHSQFFARHRETRIFLRQRSIPHAHRVALEWKVSAHDTQTPPPACPHLSSACLGMCTCQLTVITVVGGSSCTKKKARPQETCFTEGPHRLSHTMRQKEPHSMCVGQVRF